MQAAGKVALELPHAYYTALQIEYLERREVMLRILEETGFKPYPPSGAYYVMTDISGFGFDDDVEAARVLTAEARVAPVPGSSFYSRPELGRTKLRFSFPKRLETLRAAGERLRAWVASTTRS